MKKVKRDKVTGKCGGIARILEVDAEAAERFVREVQANFPDRDSSVKAIYAYLRMQGPRLSEISPVRVAAGLRAAANGIPETSKSRKVIQGPGDVAAETQPPTRSAPNQDVRDAAASSDKHRLLKKHKRVPTVRRKRQEREHLPPPPLHDARDATSELAKCPHGILMIRPCAICKRGGTTPYD